MNEQVLVEIDLLGHTTAVGTAYFHVTRGQVSTTFRYSDEYLVSRHAYPIDPQLPLSSAPYSVPGLPGAFSDCAPDRWGRNLVAKQHRRLVADGASRQRQLSDVDYLLGVSDLTRQGALRFRRSPDGEFLGAGAHVPRMLSLPELQRAADEVTEGSDAAVKRLLVAGTGSLGGARPKASVSADEDRLLIAKFSRPTDPWSIIVWERLTLELAHLAGISTPSTQLLRIDARPVLVLDRFDRVEDRRLGYMSAMTAAGRRDGEPGDYLDIVEAIEDVSMHWRRDCAELYRRVAFSVAMHNTDDHLRNHGFIRHEAGWQLCPVFDVNPEPDPAVERQTAINGITAAADEAAALIEFAPLCHLTVDTARTILTEVIEAVTQWRSHAAALKVPSSEMSMMGGIIDAQLERLKVIAADPSKF